MPDSSAPITDAAVTAAAPVVHRLMSLPEDLAAEPDEIDLAAARQILEAAAPHIAAARLDAAITVLDIRPGDRIVIRVRHVLDDAEIQRIAHLVRYGLRIGDIPVIVLEDGAELSVLRPEGAAAGQAVIDHPDFDAAIRDFIARNPAEWRVYLERQAARQARPRITS